MPRVDVVVVGAGAMGSSAAWHLARRGRSVALLEQFEQGHGRGSSHGASRVFRLAYADADYVRLAQRAERGWREMEDDVGEVLLDTTGGVDHGEADAVASLARTLTASGVEHTIVPAREAAQRWPGLRFDGPVLHHPAAGRCRSAAAVASLQRRVGELGGEIRFGVAVDAVVPTGAEGVEVRTADGTWRAGVAVVAAGAWVGRVAAAASLPPIEVTREQWFHFRARRDDADRWPSFIHHLRPDATPTFVYGLGTPGEGVKVAEHHTGSVVDPDGRTFEVEAEGAGRIRRYVEEWLPGLDPTSGVGTTCLYSSTPSEDFVLDRVGPVVVASPCSGHGFKFTPEVGRLLADLADGHPPAHQRFTLAAHHRPGVRPLHHR